MYEELIENLRSVKDTWQTEDENWMLQAADAIEELQQIAGHYEETAKDYFKDVCYYLERVPKWIPVEERLPGAEQVLINLHYSDNINEVSLGEHWNCPDDPMEDGWGGFGGNGVVTHWMPLPEPPKEET